MGNETTPEDTHHRRNLRWIGDSPLLIREGAPECMPELSLPRNSRVARPDGPPPRRLGLYFEDLLAELLRRDSSVRRFARNIPVRAAGAAHGGRTTLGEFDFLYRYREQDWHLETALKFYLGTGDLAREENWYGPNCVDRMAIKLDRIRHHQLLLPHKPGARGILRERGYRDLQSRCYIKGRLFYPHALWRRAEFPAPPAVNPGHLKGWWCPLRQLPEIMDNSGPWMLLPKSDWMQLSPDNMCDRLLTSAALEDHLRAYFQKNARPVMVAALSGDPVTERHRGFVVPDHWPFTRAPTPDARKIYPVTPSKAGRALID